MENEERANQPKFEDSINEDVCMVGDINLFCAGSTWSECAEISIMIAEPSYRRRGFGTEAAKLMMSYAVTNLQVQCFVAKISVKNEASIKMFVDRLHYSHDGDCNVFNEVTLKYDITLNWKKHFSIPNYSLCKYSDADCKT